MLFLLIRVPVKYIVVKKVLISLLVVGWPYYSASLAPGLAELRADAFGMYRYPVTCLLPLSFISGRGELTVVQLCEQLLKIQSKWRFILYW